MIYSTKVNKIISHFHITQKYFYKYLQIRHYVSIRNGGLSIGNYYNFLYNFFLCSSDTQKFVSKFYSMLVEHRQNKLTDLQKSWSKKMGMILMLLHGKTLSNSLFLFLFATNLEKCSFT